MLCLTWLNVLMGQIVNCKSKKNNSNYLHVNSKDASLKYNIINDPINYGKEHKECK